MWGPKTLAENHRLLLLIRVTNFSTQHSARSSPGLILLDERASLLPHRLLSDTLLSTPRYARDETTQTLPVLTLRKFRKHVTKSRVNFTTDRNTVFCRLRLSLLIKKLQSLTQGQPRRSREPSAVTAVCAAHTGWLCCA